MFLCMDLEPQNAILWRPFVAYSILFPHCITFMVFYSTLHIRHTLYERFFLIQLDKETSFRYTAGI